MVIHKCSDMRIHALENKGKEMKTVRVTGSIEAFREHGKLKGCVVKSRTSIVTAAVLTFWWSKGSLM